jgi:hypothetical protein
MGCFPIIENPADARLPDSSRQKEVFSRTFDSFEISVS